MTKRFLSPKEAAQYLGIEEDELQRIAEQGKIPAYKIGGVYTRFRVDDLEHYRNKNPRRVRQEIPSSISDNIKDFFYFNNFYIFSAIAITVILYFIFK